MTKRFPTPPGFSMEALIVSPKDAAAWLNESRTVNRNTKGNNLSRLAAALVRNEWKFNGDTIVFDKDGNILNGHHRLEACVKTGIPFATIVVRGIEPDSMESIDIGSMRSMSDALKFSGHNVKNATTAIAIARQTFMVINGRPVDKGWMARAVTRADLQEFVVENAAELQEAALRGMRSRNLVAAVAVGAMAMIVEDRDLFVLFHDELVEGSNLSAGSPILTLRNWAITNRATIRNPNEVHLSVLIRAFNAFQRGESLQKLYRWHPGMGSDFPSVDKPRSWADKYILTGEIS